MKSYLFYFLLIICRANVYADNTDTAARLEKANTFYIQGQYAEAKEVYLDLIKSGLKSSELFYNLGTCEAQLGNAMPAYTYLKKARSLAPFDARINHNIDKILTHNDQLSQMTFNDSKVTDILSASTWLLIFFCFLSSFAIVLLIRKFTVYMPASIVYSLAVICLIVLVPTAISYYNNRVVEKAVVLNNQKILSGPGERFPNKSEVIPGTSVVLKSYSDKDYQQVQLEDGNSGYIKKSGLLPL